MKQQEELKTALENEIDEPVEIAMRYGNPGSGAGFDALLKKNPSIEEVIAVPLYPHYAMSSYETAVEYAKEIHQKKKYSFKLSFIEPFYNDADYLNALAENIRPFLNEAYDQLLFSYHGIPERHIRKSDMTGVPLPAGRKLLRSSLYGTCLLLQAPGFYNNKTSYRNFEHTKR